MEMSTSVALRCRHVISANQWLISIASLSLLLAWRVIQVYDILLSVYICFLPRPGSPRRHLSSQFHLTVSSHIYIPILTITTFFLFHTRFKFNRISLIWKRKKKWCVVWFGIFCSFFFLIFPFPFVLVWFCWLNSSMPPDVRWLSSTDSDTRYRSLSITHLAPIITILLKVIEITGIFNVLVLFQLSMIIIMLILNYSTF